MRGLCLAVSLCAGSVWCQTSSCVNKCSDAMGGCVGKCGGDSKCSGRCMQRFNDCSGRCKTLTVKNKKCVGADGSGSK